MPRTIRTRSPKVPAVSGATTASPASEIIKGISLTVRGTELVVRVSERVRWHRERADVLIEQLTKLADVERAAAEDLANILGRYESPRAILEKRLREHRDRATFLAFIRDHLAPNAVYRLESADLQLMDLIRDRSSSA